MSRPMRNLRFAIIRDLIADLRSLPGNAPEEWVGRCLAEVRLLFRIRHSMRLDAFGWPVVLREPSRCSVGIEAKAHSARNGA